MVLNATPGNAGEGVAGSALRAQRDSLGKTAQEASLECAPGDNANLIASGRRHLSDLHSAIQSLHDPPHASGTPARGRRSSRAPPD